MKEKQIYPISAFIIILEKLANCNDIVVVTSQNTDVFPSLLILYSQIMLNKVVFDI